MASFQPFMFFEYGVSHAFSFRKIYAIEFRHTYFFFILYECMNKIAPTKTRKFFNRRFYENEALVFRCAIIKLVQSFGNDLTD